MPPSPLPPETDFDSDRRSETPAATRSGEPSRAAVPLPDSSRAGAWRTLDDEDDDEGAAEGEGDLPHDGTRPRTELPSLEGGSVWRAWIYSISVMLVVFFGAGREVWALGGAVALMGLVLVAAPPRFRLPWVPAMALFALALVPGVGLLPSSWFGGVEAWRAGLKEAWGLVLPDTVSPQPASTLEAWMVLVAGLVWLAACLGQNFSEAGRRVVVRVLAAGGILLAAASLLEVWAGVKVPWWPRQGSGFGPFANPNHSSSLCALVCVLCAAAAHDAWRRRSRWWLVFAAGVLLPVAAIFVNSSRGGLVLFFLGIVTWVATTAMRRGFIRKLAVSLALILTVLSVVLVSGGRLGQRLKAEPLSRVAASDLRVRLAQETAALALGAPWKGRGLGTFAAVFPLVAGTPLPETRPIHPESDVLWLLFEGGLLALLPCVVLVVWVVRATGPWQGGRRRRRRGRSLQLLRKSAAIAGGLAVCHAAFDVPLHSLGYFLVAALVLAQAVNSRNVSVPGGLPLSLGFRAAGLALLAAGLGWVGVAGGWLETGLPGTARKLHDRAVAEADVGRRTEAAALVRRALAITPLDFRLYYLRAQLNLLDRGPADRSLLDFGRVRALEPRFAPICMQEGLWWLHFSPKMALIPWRECLRRYPPGDAGLVPVFQNMVIAAVPYPELAGPLWALADRVPLQMVFFDQAPPSEVWDRSLGEFLAAHPRLEGLEDGQVKRLIQLWRQKGDNAQLLKWLRSSPVLQAFGWRILSAELARTGQYEQAFKLANQHLRSPKPAPGVGAADVHRLERECVLNPTDLRPVIELYYAQRAAGAQAAAARHTLQRALEMPNAPKYLKLELATLTAELGDYRSAWDQIRIIMDGMPEAEDPMPDRSSAVEGAFRGGINRPLR